MTYDRRLFSLVTTVASLGFANVAFAQPVTDIGVTPAPLPPSQPGQAPPPQYPQYQQQQPQYPQYPQYQQQPGVQQRPQYAPGRGPKTLKYKDGDPVPFGYHLEERPRSGMVIGGMILVLVPYSIGAFASLAADFGNSSAWLFAPVLGPWLTMGVRRYYKGCGRNDGAAEDDLGCVADVFVVMGLVIDGVMQAAGATLLLVGYLNPRTEAVRDDAKLKIRPMNIGTGYGLGVGATF